MPKTYVAAIDRRVIVLNPDRSVASDHPRLFSEFADVSNIVLLGDPGAGKTELFQTEASRVNGTFVPAIRFLLRDPAQMGDPLYIDGLDERRSTHTDFTTTDQFVAKLKELRPSRVRISCRSFDWFGRTDFDMFSEYFGSNGCAVLQLLDLDADEQKRILASHGVADGHGFLREAAKRGWAEQLGNPQFLIDLARVVTNGTWPQSKSELMRLATDLLLTESNRIHAEKDAGVYSAEAVRSVAGKLMTVRLLADIEGIRLSSDKSTGENFSIHDIDNIDAGLCREVLGRRVFRAIDDELADYSHRIYAEYLAARLLADMVSEGFPLARIQPLLSVGGRPATELRGIWAWLATLSPGSRRPLISGDPYGMLIYGDASSLSPSDRVYLIDQLGRLGEEDPSFAYGDGNSAAFSGLFSSEVADEWVARLSDLDQGFSVRKVLLDALATVEEKPAPLRDCLVAIALCADEVYGIRFAALNALVGDAFTLASICRKLFDDGCPRNADDVRLAVAALEVVPDGLPIEEYLVELANEAMRSDYELPLGVFWSLPKFFDGRACVAVLNGINPPDKIDYSDPVRDNCEEVLRLFDRLFCKVLEDNGAIAAIDIYAWLLKRQGFGPVSVATVEKDLKNLLETRSELASSIFNHALMDAPIDQSGWYFAHHFGDLTLNTTWGSEAYPLFLRAAQDNNLPDEKRLVCYEAALTYWHAEDFELLYQLAKGKQSLEEARDKLCVHEIKPHHWEYIRARAERRVNEKEDGERMREEFAEQAPHILSRPNYFWLERLGRIYFGMYSNVDSSVSPWERLSMVLGPANASLGLDILRQVPSTQTSPTLDEIVQFTKEKKWCPWWLALLAGLNEAWDKDAPMGGYTDEQAVALILVDELHGYTSGLEENSWREAIKSDRPDSLACALVELARIDLALQAEHIRGVYQLMHTVELKPFRERHLVSLFGEFPDMPISAWSEILPVLVGESARDTWLFELVEAREDRGSAEVRSLLLCVGAILWPDSFLSDFTNYASKEPAALWVVSDVFAHLNVGALQSQILANILEALIPHWPTVWPPEDGWSGNANAWDATRFIHSLISALSRVPGAEAAECLARLCEEPENHSYSEFIKSALASQRRVSIDDEFMRQRPDWGQVLEILDNGPPASASDLFAILRSHIETTQSDLDGMNSDIYKQFWNTDMHARVVEPRVEEVCRDVLLEIIRGRVSQHISFEPEGHMKDDKRADIAAVAGKHKVFIELKRDSHRDVWTAIESQLERLYLRDPDCSGFGMYGVFWFGERDGTKISTPPGGIAKPTNASEMQAALLGALPERLRGRVFPFVLDVSPPAS